MTSLQFLHTPLPDLDTYQLSTQSDLRFLHNCTVIFAPLTSCHVTLDDVMMTSLFVAPSGIRDYAYAKFE